MGKLARILLLIIFLISFGLPIVAVKVREMISTQDEKILELDVSLREQEDKVNKMKQERDSAQKNLASEQSRSEGLQAKLSTANTRIEGLEEKVKQSEAQLNNYVVANKKLEEELKKLGEEKASLEEQLLSMAAEVPPQRSIPRPEEARGEGGEGVIKQEGRIVAVSGKRFLTISLGGEVTTNSVAEFFIHRGGNVLGKAYLKKIHGATIVIAAEDEQSISGIREGDVVQLEGEEKLIPGLYEGSVAQVSGHGFAGINLDEKSISALKPVFLVYRGGDFMGKVATTRVVSVFVITELVPAKYTMRINEGDYLRTPR